MYYILKPIWVPIIWLKSLIGYGMLNVFTMIVFFKTIPYHSVFNNGSKCLRLKYIHEFDNNPLDTFRRYWNENYFWDK